MNASNDLIRLSQDLEEFLSENPTLEGFLPLLKNYKIEVPHLKFSSEYYIRHEAFRNDTFEIMFVAWEKGVGTCVHDHAANGCLMSIISGQLRETRFIDDNELITELPAGKSAYIDNNQGVHKLENVSNGPSVSMHIYSPPGYVSPRLDKFCQTTKLESDIQSLK